MAVTWEPLVRLISNLEKAHPRGPGNIPGKFQSDRTGGRRETAVAYRHTDTHTDRHTYTEIAGIIDRLLRISAPDLMNAYQHPGPQIVISSMHVQDRPIPMSGGILNVMH